jgi:plastocyanin
MKSISTIVSMAISLPFIAGCGDNGLGGGASQETSVVVLPADLLTDGEGDAVEIEPDSDDGGTEATGSGPGNFSGRVVLTGTAPTLGPIHTKGANIKDAEVCAAVDMPNERLVTGADNGVANVFIYMQKAPKGTAKPTPLDEAVIFDQKNCRFLPHCLVVPTGQLVKVLSNDTVGHNTHSYPARNNAINNTVSPGDRVGALQFTYKSSEREPLRVVCDFHSWMIAWHLPVDHPFVALTDADGNFEITDLPSGDHVFTVWHEAAKGKFVKRKLKVTVQPGQTTTQEIEYAASQLEL